MDRLRRPLAISAGKPSRGATPRRNSALPKLACAAGDHFLAQLDPDTLERVMRPDPLPADTIEILTALRRATR